MVPASALACEGIDIEIGKSHRHLYGMAGSGISEDYLRDAVCVFPPPPPLSLLPPPAEEDFVLLAPLAAEEDP